MKYDKKNLKTNTLRFYEMNNPYSEKFVNLMHLQLFSSDFSKFRTCVGSALGKCNETTPANLMDAFFKFLKKITPCALELQKVGNATTENSGLSLAPISSLILIVTAFLVKQA